jgi:hypothetical protein
MLKVTSLITQIVYRLISLWILNKYYLPTDVDLGGTSMVYPYKCYTPVEIMCEREREKLGCSNLVAPPSSLV